MNIRPAVAADAGLLLAWRNDPVTRAMSLETGDTPPERHAEWLAAKLADPTSELWIGEVNGLPVAQVRLDLAEPGVAVVSISVAPDARGRGHAGAALTEAMAAQRLGPSTFRATVRRENTASLRLFETAGFSAVGGDATVVQFERPAPPGR